MLIETHEILLMMSPAAAFGVAALFLKLLFDRAERAASREVR